MNPTTPYNTNELLAKAKTMSGELQGVIDRGQGGADISTLAGDTQLADIGKPIGSYLPPTDLGTPYDPTGGELSTGDESRIREGVMAQYQGEINSAKDAYARLLAEQKQLGLGRLGESTAIQARRGLIGSSFGSGMTESARGTNLKAEDTVLQGQASAIANIMARANEQASSEIAAKRAAKKSGYEALTAYNKELPTKRKTYAAEVAANLLAQGLDYSALSSSDMKQLQGLGINQQDIISAYLSKKSEQDAAESEAAQKGIFTLGEGQARYDASGKLIAQRAKTYEPKPVPTDTGSIYDRFDTKTAAAIIKEGDKFANQPIVKKYNDIVSAANFINATDPNTQNAATHQAMVYNFAKMLDPDSVVREGEYNTVKKYSQSLLSRYGGEIKQAISGKGFLSADAIKAIQDETKNRVDAYAPQYTNIKTQYSNRIKNISGQDVGDMVLSDYEEGYTAGQDTVDPEVQSLLDQGYTQEQIDQIINS